MKKLIDTVIECVTILFILFSLVIFTNIIKTTLIPFHILYILHDGIFLIILFLWLVKILIHKEEEIIKKTFLDWPLILLIITGIILTNFSIYKRLTEEYIFEMSKYIIFCFFIIHNFNNYKSLKRILLVILIPSIIIGTGGIIEFIKNVNFSIFIKNPLHFRLIDQFIEHPNLLAPLMAIGIVITIGFILENKDKVLKLIFVILLIILSICLILCFSISGYLQLFVSVLLLGILIKKPKINKFFILILSILVFLFLSRIIFLSTPTKESGLERFFIWNVTSQMIKDKPFTGCGLGNFNTAYAWYRIKYSHPKNYTIAPGDANNSLFHLCSEYGFIFLFILFWIIISISLNLVRLYKSNKKEENIIGFITGCILIGFIGYSLFQHRIDFSKLPDRAYNIILWSCLGIFTSFVNMKSNYYKCYKRKSILIILFIFTITHLFFTSKRDIGVIYFHKGVNYETEGKYIQAIKQYKKSISVDPNWVVYHVRMGYCYYKSISTSKSQKVRKQYINQTIKKYEKAILLSPYDISLYRHLAYIYYSLGAHKLAYEYFKKVEKFEKYINGTIWEWQY